jgi:tetratricopeptide (TPR) repeat protein
MSEHLNSDEVFLGKLTEIILANLKNENFGVKELTHESGMSIYRLNRRLNSINKKTCNQFIREIRLQKAFELLQDEAYTVAEVAYKTGFGSSNYFHKCFHEYFGYPPGNVKKGVLNNPDLYNLAQGVTDFKPGKIILRNYFLTLPGILLLVILSVIVAFLLYKKIHKTEWSNDLRNKDGRISLAVMPFRNQTNDTTWNIWQEGIQNSLITYFINFEELKVRQTETINGLLQSKGLTNYASLTPAVLSDISRKLDANLFISGNIIRAGDEIRVAAQIYDSEKEEAIKSFEIEGSAKEEIVFHIIDSLKKQIKDFLIISKLNKELYTSDLWLPSSAKSTQAYKDLVDGEKAWFNEEWNTAINLFMRAIKADSNLYEAYGMLSTTYLNQDMYDQAKEWCRKYYSKLDIMDRENKIFATMNYHKYFFKDDFNPIKYLKQAIEIDDQEPTNYWKLANCYSERSQYEKAIPEYEKALEIYRNKWKVKPNMVENYTFLGKVYHKTGQYKKEKKLYKKAEEDFTENLQLIARQAILSLTLKDTVSANQYLKEYISILKDNSSSEADILFESGEIYWEADMLNIAEGYYRKALTLEPDNPRWMNALAWFLVENDRDVDESLELVDKALKLRPDNIPYLDTKGWGLYKQGKYRESLEILQKAWDIIPIYSYINWSHLEAVKKAVAGQK